MTAALVSTGAQTQTRLTGALSYVPRVALGLDLLLITVSVFIAMIAGPLCRSPPQRWPDLGTQLNVAGPLMSWAGWPRSSPWAVIGPTVFGAGVDEYKHVVNASLIAAALIGIACYLRAVPALPRLLRALLPRRHPTAPARSSTLLRRSVHRARRARRPAAPRGHRRCSKGTSTRSPACCAARRGSATTWSAHSLPSWVGASRPTPASPCSGPRASVAQVALDADADVVFLAGGAFDSSADMRRLAWELEHEEVQVVIAPSVTDVSSERVRVRPSAGCR